MSEKDCLNYYYKKGYEWNENKIRLYDVLDRVSCWCCSNKNNKELKNYKKYLPEYFEKIYKLSYEIWLNTNSDSLTITTSKFLRKLEKIKMEE